MTAAPRAALLSEAGLEAVFAHLRDGAGPRIVLGDLNTPRRELPDGTVWTFARDRHGRLREERGERWDTAESALIRGLEPHGFRDAFRELNGFGARGPAVPEGVMQALKTPSAIQNPRRLYLLASRALECG